MALDFSGGHESRKPGPLVGLRKNRVQLHSGHFLSCDRHGPGRNPPSLSFGTGGIPILFVSKLRSFWNVKCSSRKKDGLTLDPPETHFPTVVPGPESIPGPSAEDGVGP